MKRMIARGLNSPLTSSCGRLFDAVEAASGYEFEMMPGDWARREPARISAHTFWRQLIQDLHAGAGKRTIAARFHAGFAAAFVAAAAAARQPTGIGQVALTGGCMHNRRLARLLRLGLEAQGFQVLQQTKVSPGDAGLSYGQAIVATAAVRVRE